MAAVRQTREQAKQQTREALLLAALELFTAEGIEGPSLDRICEKAGYTRGAFYVHFKGREDLLAAVMERILHEFTDTIEQTADAGGDLGRTVGNFTMRMAELSAGKGEPFLAVGQAHLGTLVEACQRSPDTRARFVALLQDATVRLTDVVSGGQRAGTVRADIPAEQVADILVYAVFGILVLQQTGFERDVAGTAVAALKLLQPGTS